MACGRPNAPVCQLAGCGKLVGDAVHKRRWYGYAVEFPGGPPSLYCHEFVGSLGEPKRDP